MQLRRRYQTPKKPDKQGEKLDTLWEMVCNELIHRIELQDIKVNFVLLALTLICGLLAVIIVLTAKAIW